MRTATITLSVVLLVSACGGSTHSGLPLSGDPLSKTADAMNDHLVRTSVLVNEDVGVELLTESEYRCAAGRLIAEFGPEDVDDAFSQVAEPDLFDSVIAGWSEAMLKCGDFRKWAASFLVEEVEATLDVELGPKFFDCLVEELPEAAAHALVDEQVFHTYANPLYDKTLRWVNFGVHVPLNFCAPEIAPVLGALKAAKGSGS
jgi:hypothetical protein